MLGGFINLATMDWLDWLALGAACIAGFVLTVHAFAGINVFQPHSSMSALGGLTLGSLLACAGLLGAEQYWPVRTTLYMVNGDSLPLLVESGDRKGCLVPKSYSVWTWRWDSPGQLLVTDPVVHSTMTLTLTPGTWVVNPSKTRVSADFINQENHRQDTLMVNDNYLLKVNVASGKLYRMFAGNPIDHVYSTEGDIVARSLEEQCE